jgi:hypothetical protein
MIIKEMLKKEEGFSMTTLSHQRCKTNGEAKHSQFDSIKLHRFALS